jgi:hypothetical protein
MRGVTGHGCGRGVRLGHRGCNCMQRMDRQVGDLASHVTRSENVFADLVEW